MTKTDLMQRFDDVVTDRRLTVADCASHLGCEDYLLEEYRVIASAGSSGRRGVFLYGWDAWATCYASILRFQLREWSMDPRLAGIERVTATVAASQPSHLSAAIRSTFSRPSHPAVLFPVSLPISDIVAGLNDLSPTILMGYSSFLPRLAREARAGRLRIAPRRVITISEPLLPELRTLLEQTWQVPVANAYGMSEGVFSGFCGHGNHLPDDLCIIESIDADGNPVAPGEISSRVLITNLYNAVLPLIRYEVTDELRIESGPCPCGCAFSRVVDPQGRLDEMFEYGTGTVIHPHVFRSVLGHEASIIEYQMRQTPAGADAKIVTAGSLDTSSLAKRLEAAAAHAGLAHASVTIEVVDAIERAASGKLRRFVPLPRDGV